MPGDSKIGDVSGFIMRQGHALGVDDIEGAFLVLLLVLLPRLVVAPLARLGVLVKMHVNGGVG